MINTTDEERKEILLHNGLYATSKRLIKCLHNQTINEEEYINEMRNLFKLYEQLKEKK